MDLKRARSAGAHYRAEGHSKGNNPHKEGSELWLAWNEGWDEVDHRVNARNMTLDEIPFTDIEIGDRFRKDSGDMADLTISIVERGLISPIAVQATPNGSKPYILLAGERRLEASKRAGLANIPARIFKDPLSEEEIRLIELHENLYRKDFEWKEEVALTAEIHRLQQAIHGKAVPGVPDSGHGLKETAAMTGKHITTIHQDVQLHEALSEVPELEKAKNKTEAKKILQRVKKRLAKEELSKRVRRRENETPEGKLKKQLTNSFVVRDFFAAVQDIQSESIDLVEIDPPYGIDFKTAASSEPFAEVPKDDYPDFIKKVIEESYRVAKKHSWIILWYGSEWLPMVINICKQLDWNLPPISAFWVKDRTVRTLNPSYHLATQTEEFLYIRKGQPGIMKQGRSNVFSFPGVYGPNRTHPAEHPIELTQEILTTFTRPGATILVPFAGSGNTLLAGANLGMTGVGYDTMQAHKDSFVLKVDRSKYGEYKSYGGHGS